MATVKVTDEQIEKYLHHRIIDGDSQRQAYIKTFDCGHWSDNALDVEACNLEKNPRVALRREQIEENIRKACDKKTVMSALERMEYCTRVLMGEEKEKIVTMVGGTPVEAEVPASLQTRSRYLDIMNKMDGQYVTKIEGNVNVKLEDLI